MAGCSRSNRPDSAASDVRRIGPRRRCCAPLVERCAQAGAKFIYPYFGVTLRDRQREYFLECLEKSRPDVRKKYLVLGEQYDNRCPNEKELWQVFCEECKKYGILWRMEQIITASKEPYQNEQLCLFR